MAIKATHELHQRRASRNIGVGLTLAALVVVVLGLTLVKVTNGDPMQGFDHAVRPEMAAPVQGEN